MKKGIYSHITKLIGNTPIVQIHRLSTGSNRVLAKLESFNPSGSVKDRTAMAMISDAEQRGLLKPGTIIVEPTSGNTGIALAMICAQRGYHLILTMPENMSLERRRLLQLYGAELVLTPAEKGMKGAIEEAEKIRNNSNGAIILDQFRNPSNPKIHEETTGPEIWIATGGRIDIVVAGIGTGGTITGVARYLKRKKSDIKIVGVEPAGSPVLSGGKPGPHRIQGIGAGFIPPLLERELIDEIVAIKDEYAISTARALARYEGISAGISSGAIMWTALNLPVENKTICAILPDGAEKYLADGLLVS